MNLSPRQRRNLDLMGIALWVDRNAPAAEAEFAAVAAVPAERREPAPEAEWESLRQQVLTCTRCALHKGRTNAVFGVGNRTADWMFIGEAPGRDEDLQGEPFVGRAGKLLNSILAAMGMRREDIYIANILKSRPPQNRDPKPEEVDACRPYLEKQIALVRPRIIVALGRIAAHNLLRVETPIGRMRGQRYEYPNPKVPVVVTYHPAYLLRSPREKSKVWQDLCFAMNIYKESR
jgi:DNA polymerase